MIEVLLEVLEQMVLLREGEEEKPWRMFQVRMGEATAREVSWIARGGITEGKQAHVGRKRGHPMYSRGAGQALRGTQKLFVEVPESAFSGVVGLEITQ